MDHHGDQLVATLDGFVLLEGSHVQVLAELYVLVNFDLVACKPSKRNG